MKKGIRQPPEATLLKNRMAIFELIFGSIYNGVMVTDADGLITHFNKPYGRFLGLDPDALNRQTLHLALRENEKIRHLTEADLIPYVSFGEHLFFDGSHAKTVRVKVSEISTI